MPQFVQVFLLWVLKSVVLLILLSLFYKRILVLFLIQRMTPELWEGGKIPDLPKYQSSLRPWKQFNSDIVFLKPMLGKCVCSPEHRVSLGFTLAMDSVSIDKLESPITYGLSQVILLLDVGSTFLLQHALSVDWFLWLNGVWE